MKYQDAKTAWHRIFQPANHAAQEEGPERGEGSANGQLTRQKRPIATGGEPKLGLWNSTKTRKLDEQKVQKSGGTKAVSHWSGTTGKRKAGKGRGSQGRQAQLSGRQRRYNRRQPAQIKGDHNQPKICQGATPRITHREDTPSANNEEITKRATTAVMNALRGVKRKQVQTDRGKVLKSRMLGV